VIYTDEEFDELLTASLYRAAELDYMADMPSDEELDKMIQPSLRFQRRMKALLRNPKRYIRNIRRPVYLKILRSAAAVFISFVILLGAAMAVSPTVRAAVSNFVRSWFEDRTEYWTPEDGENKEWSFGYIPEGFELLLLDEVETNSYRVYQNAKAETIVISISTGSRIIDNEHSIFYEAVIGGRAADVYESIDPEYQHIIVLHDEESGVVISIISDIEMGTLIQIAEGIE
jgi:hypothetical protein